MIRNPFLTSILLQGDRGNGMYFVETGTLVVLKQIDGEEKEVKPGVLRVVWREGEMSLTSLLTPR